LTIRFTFDLTAVTRLADHAARASLWVHPAGSGAETPGLLLGGDRYGVYLTSNGLPSPQPFTDNGQPAVLAHERTPAPASLLDAGAVFCKEVSLCAPGGHGLLAQLRAGVAAGFTTVTVTVCTAGVDVAISRRRTRRPHAALTAATRPAGTRRPGPPASTNPLDSKEASAVDADLTARIQS
jgi:hypothetical protein